MKRELETVMHERDMLATRLRTDVHSMQAQIKALKSDYEATVSGLQTRLVEQRELNETMRTRAEHAERALVDKTRHLDEMSLRCVDLDKQLSEARQRALAETERRVRETELASLDKMASMNERLNEARREQAKAVVVMRQMEMSTSREKERLEALLKSCDAYYKDHIDKLQAKCHALEKETNATRTSSFSSSLLLKPLGGLVHKQQQ